jgi:3-oxoacyl-[acyl-carrier protein] reductase
VSDTSLTSLSAAPSSAVDLSGRVGVVTGAARGLGRQIAELLARNGARVGLVDLNPSTETQRAIADHGGIAEIVEADVTDRELARHTLEGIAARWGRLDVLVNNAGVSGRIGLDDIADDVFDRQVAVNLKAAMYWTRAAAPLMRRTGGGKIVNISSISARVGGVDSFNPKTGKGRSGPIYAAAKGGIIAFTRWSARELGPDAILVNAVCPGPIRTDLTVGFEYDLASVPIAHIGDPLDVAYAVLFLASQMSNHVTGQALNVDGGMRMD